MPVPDFTYTCHEDGNTIRFNDTTKIFGDTIARWNWNFGDGVGASSDKIHSIGIACQEPTLSTSPLRQSVGLKTHGFMMSLSPVSVPHRLPTSRKR